MVLLGKLHTLVHVCCNYNTEQGEICKSNIVGIIIFVNCTCKHDATTYTNIDVTFVYKYTHANMYNNAQSCIKYCNYYNVIIR